MIICEMIVSYIVKLIEQYVIQKFPEKIKKDTCEVTYKMNISNLISGIYDSLIFDIVCGTLTDDKLIRFCKSYIVFIENKKDRSFPRNSKTPFSKWYVKGYSNQTKYAKIFKAVIEGTVDELEKNLKTIARKIIKINDKKYG